MNIVEMAAEDQLVANIERLMAARRMTQWSLAQCLGWPQPKLSRKLGRKIRFRVQDLDEIARVLGVTVPELFFDAYGQWDRRTGLERRKGDRRRQTLQPRPEAPDALAEAADGFWRRKP